MLGLSVNLSTLFLGRLGPLKQLTRTQCPYSHQYLTLPFLNQWNDHRKDFMIDFHESMWPDQVWNLVPLTPKSEVLPTAPCGPASCNRRSRSMFNSKTRNNITTNCPHESSEFSVPLTHQKSGITIDTLESVGSWGSHHCCRDRASQAYDTFAAT